MKEILFEARNLNKTLSKIIFDNVNFSITPKDNIGIYSSDVDELSILYDCLCGIDKPTSGEVLYNNKNLWKISEDEKYKLRNLEIGIANTAYINWMYTIEQFFLVVMHSLKESSSQKQIRLSNSLKYFEFQDKGNQIISSLCAFEKVKLSLMSGIINSPKLMLLMNIEENLSKKDITEISALIEKINKDKGISVIQFSNTIQRIHGSKIYKIKNGKFYK